ncbi:hypothetical protein [Mucilaginibacter sp. KACC 22063]|uniref:hypothetical protein n=1 Tax=Mucilaginibacter sp. KACC 22063 TaxID=3025666 RepID=UPI0023666956|nr:hypothetical protein [Mucilaginibacter sp. KACC 22063]WDF57253.1 hypothetical protein PQ461_09330 [Mucilaginibacter sp. KACC 22063]
MATLTDSHREAFNKIAARLGFQPGETTINQSHPALSRELFTFGADDTADIGGKVIPVSSIADLKTLIGLPDHPEDSHVDYPQTLAKELAPNSDDLRNSIKTAAVAYLIGDPKKVADYEDLINHSLFPGKVLAFNADDLTVADGQTVVLGTSGETEVYNFGTITVAPTGTIRVVGNTSVNCQVFTQQ